MSADPSADLSADLPYVQCPTIHGERIVFSAEGNLWEVGLEGGDARRLTSSTATHTWPHFSPDGKWIAFSSADEGPAAIWVMPSRGGDAKRLTFHGMPDAVTGWTHDGEQVTFRTLSVNGPPRHSLAMVPAQGGAVTAIPYGRGTTIAYHPDGERIALQRHFGDPGWWKRYEGGRAGRIWIGSASTGEFTKLPGGPRSDCSPMWIGDSVWFVSDHDGMGDLWRADADGGNRTRITSHETYYARRPTTDGTRIVYSMGGDLYVIDATAENPAPQHVPVRIGGHSLASRRKFVNAARAVSAFGLDQKGEELLLTVRGRVVRLPNWHGAARVIGAVDGVRFREACWLGESGKIAAITQINGVDQLVLLPGDGIAGDMDHVTVLGDVGRRVRSIHPSPDGRRIALVDQGRGLHVAAIAENHASAGFTVVDDEGSRWMGGVAWSPCSTWLAFTRSLDWWATRVLLWDAADGAIHSVSGDQFNDFAPAWDPEGRFLAFLSSRHMNPYPNQLEHDFAFTAATRAYVVMLRKRDETPFDPAVAPQTGPRPGGPPNGGPAPEADSDGNDGDASRDPLEIDVQGMADRAVVLPFKAGRYSKIACSKNAVAVLAEPVDGMMEGADPKRSAPESAVNSIRSFDLNERKEEQLFGGVSDFAVSGNGQKWLVRFGLRYRVVPAGRSPEGTGPMSAMAKMSPDAKRPSPKSGWIDMSRVRLDVEPRAEYRQILDEAWAMQRDHFYDEELVQVDWAAIRNRYAPLVDRIRTREELVDLLWEMQGELGTSHAYAMGGDMPRARSYSPGQLGCDFVQDPATGAFRISHIYRGDVWAEGKHSPLAAPGKNVKEGDYLLAIDGRPCGGETAPGHWLLETAGKCVVLTVADDPTGKNSRDVTVTPIGSENYLRYREWVDTNMRTVTEATDGQIGYIHIPNMSLDGAVEFHRNFLWQIGCKRGFVIDNRYNGGGNISYILLAKLLRQVVGWTFSRWGQRARTYPYNAPMGPIVVLTNEDAGSDGDIFSQAVKSTGVGPLIGMRTWGGVVGIDRAKDLVDGGFTTQPEYAFWFPETGWSVENHGVEPDIVVDRTPTDALRNQDPQMDRAIAEVLERLKGVPDLPPDPGPRPNLAV